MALDKIKEKQIRFPVYRKISTDTCIEFAVLK